MEPKLRGFATWPKEKRIANASRAGKIAHALGRAHEFTSEEAGRAGKLSGVAKKNKTINN